MTATNLKIVNAQSVFTTEDILKAQVRYLEAKCNRLEHTNIALTSKVQEILLLRELKDARPKRDGP